MGATFEQPMYRALLPHFQRTRALANAYVCLAKSDLDGAEAALHIASDVPAHMRRSPTTLVARVLQALGAHERGQPEAGDMLAEVLSLADLVGMRQFVEDAHPRLADMLARRPPAVRVPDVSETIATPQAQAPSQTAQAPAPSAVPSGPAAAPQTLEVGAVWSGELSASVSRFADVAAVWQSRLATLARRAFSVEELRRRLTRKGHHPEVVAEAILRAQRERVLDDALFAEQYVVSRAVRGRGPGRLRRDLQALGVVTRHIEAALAKQWPEGAEPLDLARQLASRRARQLAGVPLDVRRRRVIAYLGRRGFTGATSVRITREDCANP